MSLNYVACSYISKYFHFSIEHGKNPHCSLQVGKQATGWARSRPGRPGLQGRAEAQAQGWHNADSALGSAWLTGGVSAEVKGRLACLGMGVGLAGLWCRGVLCTPGPRSAWLRSTGIVLQIAGSHLSVG